MKKRNNVVLKKISLKDFISVLIDIYEQGADYIDITGTTDEQQDVIGIQVMNDYMREILPEEGGELTDDIINQL